MRFDHCPMPKLKAKHNLNKKVERVGFLEKLAHLLVPPALPHHF